MQSDFDSLESIVGAAVAHARLERKAKAAKKVDSPAEQSTQLLYLDPKNWKRTKGVALIHEETETLLGNFSEYVHRTVPNCRKLVREDSLLGVSAAERVSGSWWLGQDRIPEERKEWHEVHPCIIHLHLDKLFVHAPCCELNVHLSYGSIARVDLIVDTQFAAEAGQGEQLLTLPAGTNVLEVMSLDSKLAVRSELGI